nr:hypothetical protein Q903MT_gene6197 [Picea sitchensis]
MRIDVEMESLQRYFYYQMSLTPKNVPEPGDQPNIFSWGCGNKDWIGDCMT